MPEISGKISAHGILAGEITTHKTLTGTLGLSGSQIPAYTGAYEIEPDVYDDITLETANRRMLKNVTVLNIPSRTVKNVSGGDTVIIGGEKYHG